MSNFLTISRTYHDNDILFAADLDNICQSIMAFINTNKLNDDNLSSSITNLFVSSGFIMMYGASAAPTGWLDCDGSVVSQATYAALYAVVGSTYNTGGEGAGNFRLPDYRRRAPVGMGGSGTGVLGNSLGNSGGEETHQLVTSEMPSHNHSDSVGHSHLEWAQTALGSTAPNNFETTINASSSSPIVPDSFNTATGSATPTYNPTGGDGAHNNMQPSLVMNFIIKV